MKLDAEFITYRQVLQQQSQHFERLVVDDTSPLPSVVILICCIDTWRYVENETQKISSCCGVDGKDQIDSRDRSHKILLLIASYSREYRAFFST